MDLRIDLLATLCTKFGEIRPSNSAEFNMGKGVHPCFVVRNKPLRQNISGFAGPIFTAW